MVLPGFFGGSSWFFRFLPAKYVCFTYVYSRSSGVFSIVVIPQNNSALDCNWYFYFLYTVQLVFSSKLILRPSIIFILRNIDLYQRSLLKPSQNYNYAVFSRPLICLDKVFSGYLVVTLESF